MKGHPIQVAPVLRKGVRGIQDWAALKSPQVRVKPNSGISPEGVAVGLINLQMPPQNQSPVPFQVLPLVFPYHSQGLGGTSLRYS